MKREAGKILDSILWHECSLTERYTGQAVVKSLST